MVLDKETLLSQGYLTFNIKDLDESLYNDLHNSFDKENEIKLISRLRYDATIHNGVLLYSIDDFFKNLKNEFHLLYNTSIKHNIIHTNDIRLNLNLNATYSELVECKNKLDELVNISDKDQSWFYNQPHRHPDHRRIISELYKQIFLKIYPDYVGKSFNSADPFGFDLTLYEKNDFIVPHSDGVDPNRICVILVYLNDDYQPDYGGELIIEKNITVTPEFGQVVILDFTNNNVNHSVNIIKHESFKRFAFIRFFYKNEIN